jgi:DNA-binding transcriptional ArsR family regulator
MEKEIGYITSLIGDPIRSIILWTLLDNRAYTATELAIKADTTAQNLSMHLSKLLKADLLAVESQGRHKYYRLSKPEVAQAIEAIGNLVPGERRKKVIESSDNTMIKYCRTCYDHLAGKVGVMINESLIKKGFLKSAHNAYELTVSGEKFFDKLEIDISSLKSMRRPFARPCLDWSERKHHLAGALGAALLEKMLSEDYLKKSRNSRAVVVTTKGQRYLFNALKLTV